MWTLMQNEEQRERAKPAAFPEINVFFPKQEESRRPSRTKDSSLWTQEQGRAPLVQV